MKLADYINDLLHRYDCVIVPDFGGFITNTLGAKIDNNHAFYPPKKEVGFNSHLSHNDGLLANHIASLENISFEKATTAISLTVIKWKKKLQSEKVVLENLGSLSLNSENKIIFNPEHEINFLTSSFGLASFESYATLRNQVKSLDIRKEKTRKNPVFIRYAASIALFCAVGYATFSGIEKYKTNKIIIAKKEALEKKIQTATFIITEPLPTINLSVVKKEVTTPYHVVAGAFQFEKNAQKKVKQLIKKGFEAKIIGKNKWGLIQVAFQSFEKRSDAEKLLFGLRKSVAKDAWLLVR